MRHWSDNARAAPLAEAAAGFFYSSCCMVVVCVCVFRQGDVCLWIFPLIRIKAMRWIATSISGCMIKTDWLYLKHTAFLCQHHTSWHIAADVCSCGRHTFCCMTDWDCVLGMGHYSSLNGRNRSWKTKHLLSSSAFIIHPCVLSSLPTAPILFGVFFFWRQRDRV